MVTKIEAKWTLGSERQSGKIPYGREGESNKPLHCAQTTKASFAKSYSIRLSDGKGRSSTPLPPDVIFYPVQTEGPASVPVLVQSRSTRRPTGSTLDFHAAACFSIL